jgi:hypothetical protein
VCSVYFERRDGVDDFLSFLTSHADTREVRADEPNYTRIVPTFSVGEVVAAPGLAPRGDAAFRVRVIYP